MATKSSKVALDDVFHDLVRCETRLYNAVGERLRAEHGIGATQYEALRYLHGHPGSRVAEIATTFAIGVGAASKIIDRLEAHGWAERVPNPDDRRSSLISLTAAGVALFGTAAPTFRELLGGLFAPALDAGELETMAAGLAALRGALEAGRVGIPVG